MNESEHIWRIEKGWKGEYSHSKLHESQCRCVTQVHKNWWWSKCLWTAFSLSSSLFLSLHLTSCWWWWWKIINYSVSFCQSSSFDSLFSDPETSEKFYFSWLWCLSVRCCMFWNVLKHEKRGRDAEKEERRQRKFNIRKSIVEEKSVRRINSFDSVRHTCMTHAWCLCLYFVIRNSCMGHTKKRRKMYQK